MLQQKPLLVIFVMLIDRLPYLLTSCSQRTLVRCSNDDDQR
jgi:hypothetical protein